MAKNCFTSGIILKEALLGNKVEKGIVELIQQADWDDIYPRALKYALKKLSFLSGSPLEGVSKKQVAHDIVSQAILKIIDGDRKWEPGRGTILNYLIYVVKSDISHLYRLDDYKLTSRMPVSPQKDNDRESIETEELLKKAHELDKHAADISPDPPQSVDNILIEHEICDSLLEVIDGDDELESIVRCMLDGFSKPRDIAEQLGVKPKNIYNAKKRLERAYQGLLQKKTKETS
jgi:RNA polymerase sigma factor (sigma-70 family)